MPRRGQLAVIHIARQELALDEGSYRAVLRELYRHDSAAELSEREAADLIEHFRRLGWRPRQRRGPHRPATGRQLGLIRHLWRELAAAGAVAHPEGEALVHFVEHRTGKAQLGRLEVAEASAVIEGLKAWLARATGKKSGEEG
jgi:phage gp16-like protein